MLLTLGSSLSMEAIMLITSFSTVSVLMKETATFQETALFLLTSLIMLLGIILIPVIQTKYEKKAENQV